MITWDNYLSHPPTMKPNKMDIPINNLGFNDTDVAAFNEIYQYCLEQEKAGVFGSMTKTPSQGISIARENLRGPMWMITNKTSFIEIVIRNIDARYYRFIIGYGKERKHEMTGRRAFQIYTRELIKDGVDINTLSISNGLEVKKTIPSPKIDCLVAYGRTYHNAHHIDINSAYNAGMAEAFPVLAPTIKRMYDKRKEKKTYKDVLNMTQGFMQSQLVGYRFSHISKAGYVYTLRRLDELTNMLKANGARILSYNTDGIWYQGELIHGPGEGRDLGQYKYDHSNCTIRFKSKGCYEFLENNEYTPVFRGESSYERIKPREQWVWGDIFKGDLVEYFFRSGKGLVHYDTLE